MTSVEIMSAVPSYRFSFVSITLMLCALTGVLYLCAFTGCQRQPPPEIQEYLIEGPTMGTTYMVKIAESSREMSPLRLEKIESSIHSELEHLNALMSTYLEDSELSRFNRFHQIDVFFPLSEETLEVFRLSQEISEMSGGAFDITISPLVNAWGFGPGGKPSRLPDEPLLENIRNKVGYHLLELGGNGARKHHPELTVELSAIAPGYAVDRIAHALEQLECRHFMVELGGEIRAKGHNAQGNFWRIGIEKPITTGREVQRVVRLNNQSLSTSGDYRNYIEQDGVRLSHTIDPATGRPISHNLASVTVVADNCAWADGVATALMVMGPEKGMALAEQQGIAAYFIIRKSPEGFVEKFSPAFLALEKNQLD